MASRTPPTYVTPNELAPLGEAIQDAADDQPAVVDTVVTTKQARITFAEWADRLDVRRALAALDVVGVDRGGRPVELSFDPVRLAPHRLRLDPTEPVHFVATCEVIPATG